MCTDQKRSVDIITDVFVAYCFICRFRPCPHVKLESATLYGYQKINKISMHVIIH